MSNKAPSAKKLKTASARNNKPTTAALLAISLFALLSLALMPAKQAQNQRICFGSSCIIAQSASTAEQRQKGLSGRLYMPANAGMLFVFGQTDRQCMWMKDMKFNLDILWLDQKSRVINIVRNISPDTFPKSFCSDNTKYVLELNPGKADQFNLHIGDFVRL